MEKLLILGASVRAAAQSARRAGFAVYAADLFADRDLRSCSRAVKVADYPAGLAAAAASAPSCPWMYTGGLENHPDLVEEISRARPLLGNPAEVLRAVRDPIMLYGTLAKAGLRVPRVSQSPDGLPKDGSWLRKPHRGSGGTGIRPWQGEGHCAEHFFQKRVAGQSLAAVYVASRGDAVLLGATRQLVGTAWAGAGEFAYAGSVGPLLLASRVKEQLVEAGKVLAREFGQSGLFGVDAVVAGEDVWTIEVNPRYTASVEVLERGFGCRAVTMHVEASYGRMPRPLTGNSGGWCGKAIVYARRDLVISCDLGQEGDASKAEVADIPDVGVPVRRGRPVITLFAEGPDESSVLAKLKCRVAEVERMLYGEREMRIQPRISPAAGKQPG